MAWRVRTTNMMVRNSADEVNDIVSETIKYVQLLQSHLLLHVIA